MLDQQRLGSQPQEKREEVFTQRYEAVARLGSAPHQSTPGER